MVLVITMADWFHQTHHVSEDKCMRDKKQLSLPFSITSSFSGRWTRSFQRDRKDCQCGVFHPHHGACASMIVNVMVLEIASHQQWVHSPLAFLGQEFCGSWRTSLHEVASKLTDLW